MWTAFPPSDYYGPSAPPSSRQQTACLPADGLAGRKGGGLDGGSHVHQQPVDGMGAQLFPCNLATVTPQAFTVASWPTPSAGLGVTDRLPDQRALLPGPDPPGFEPVHPLEGVPPLVSAFVRLSVSLAGPEPSGGADPSRRCRGCSHPALCLQGQAASSFSDLLRQAEGGSLHPTRSYGASWRTGK